jgi:hypothetical protein
MKYIRSCENCYREIRFPIDKGTLFVTCPYCNSSFKVNPDDPILYSKGRFDLVKINQNQPEEFFFGRNFDSPFKQTEKSKSIIKLVIIFCLFSLLFFHFNKISNTPNNFDNIEKSNPEENLPEKAPDFEI